MSETWPAVRVWIDGGLLADLRHRIVADRVRGGHQAVLVGAAVLDQGAEGPGAGLVERDVGDVGDLGGARIVGGGLGSEGGLGGQVLDPRREGADRGAVHPRAGSGVDRDLRVGDRIVAGGEDAEGEAVGAEVEARRPPGRRRGPACACDASRTCRRVLPFAEGNSRRGGRRTAAAAGAVVRAAAARDRARARAARRATTRGLRGHGRHRSWGHR